ncbi:LacI family DNA-binding transcriptional regulator [Bacillus massiliglaciei]|uniref:LacI family DNA-binding transcriptional regulator n=1 Tax=Bacillus massiliglaciei TaxID=1816693 RepID=UPI000DA62634|nr:LacI family DNA-binding transcriptional regulator [Bacillus massiliglaciei]
MVTIKDVARTANVSIATVSAVINQNKFVSEELKERVEKAIHELRYRPNKVARSLKKKETKLIGVAVTEVTNPFYPHLLKGVEDTALDYGYNVLLCTTGDDPSKELELVQSMADQGADGIILGTADQADSESIVFLEEAKIPYVLINRSPSEYKGSLARINSYLVGEMAAQYLTDLGHDKLIFIGGDRLNSWERERAFIDTLKTKDISLGPDRIIRSEYRSERVYNDIQNLIKDRQIMPTAIFAASDIMAFGAIKALLDYGVKVPEDVSVMGADNIPFSEDFKVPLTTIDAKAYEIGKCGCDLLIQAVNHRTEEFEHKQIFLKPVLIERDSCKSVKHH